VLIKVLKKEKALWTQVGTGGGGFGGGSGASTPAAEIVHFNDAMKKFELDRVYYGGANAALVVDAIKDVKARMVMPAEESTFEPYTRFRLNGAEELRRAGVSVAFVPNADTPDGYKNWLYKAGQMVRYGFPAKDALRALTLTPAEFLGLADQVGSLAAGREADILFLDGPPFDVSTKVRNVMIAGELVPMEEGQ
jgi:imidazolonepropionase-like amidohydrolase